jgi:hypothetical protein
MRILSMGQWIVVCVLVGAGCEGPNQAAVRWPDHRKLEEKRISDLEGYNGKLVPQILSLVRRIAELEKQLREVREAAPPR